MNYLSYPLQLIFVLLFNVQLQAQHRIMTYNIRLDYTAQNSDPWSVRKTKVFEQIKDTKVDVFGIQEGMPNQIVDFKLALGNFEMVGVGRDDGANAGEFSALFFKKDRYELLKGGTFWLSETPDVPSKGWDAALNRVCSYVRLKDTSGTVFWVFNTHFDHVGEQARIHAIDLILDKVKELNSESEPFIVQGDLNLNDDHPAIVHLQSKLSDALLVAKKLKSSNNKTFNGFDLSSAPKRRIDYIFVSEGVQVKTFETRMESFGLSYPSDHFPLIAKIKF